MNYEKMYKEALERAKKRFDANPTDGYVGYSNEILKEIFPELEENEEEKIRKELLEVIKHCYEDGGYALCTDDYKKYSAYLERQKEQQPAEWSEEDKGNLLDVKCIIDEVWHNQDIRETIDHSREELESLWHWLDNIWQKVVYPKPSWKPSEEQMQALNFVLAGANISHYIDILFSLRNELQKL